MLNHYIDGLVQERCNSIANAMELRLSSHYPIDMNHWWPNTVMSMSPDLSKLN